MSVSFNFLHFTAAKAVFLSQNRHLMSDLIEKCFLKSLHLQTQNCCFLNIIDISRKIMFKKHSFGFCRCKDFKKHFSIKSDIKWRFWLKNTALAAVKCKKLKVTNLTWNVDYGWKHSFRFCKMLRLQNILCSQIGPKMLFYTFDV